MKHVCPHCGKEFLEKVHRKTYKVGRRDPIAKVKKMLNFLKQHEDWVWIRRIAKGTGLKPYSVSYLIEKYLTQYLDMLDPEAVYESTGIKMRMFRLKNSQIDVESVIRDLKLRTNS